MRLVFLILFPRVCGQLSGLQAKADIMSAMALIFKLKFNKTKLRLFLRESGVFKLKTFQPSLNIREGHWDNVTALPLATSGEFKSLGFIHSLGGPWLQFGTCLDYVKKVCKVIGSKMAYPRVKSLPSMCTYSTKRRTWGSMAPGRCLDIGSLIYRCRPSSGR